MVFLKNFSRQIRHELIVASLTALIERELLGHFDAGSSFERVEEATAHVGLFQLISFPSVTLDDYVVIHNQVGIVEMLVRPSIHRVLYQIDGVANQACAFASGLDALDVTKIDVLRIVVVRLVHYEACVERLFEEKLVLAAAVIEDQTKQY